MYAIRSYYVQQVVIIDGVRTPIGKHGGVLASVRPDDLLAITYKSLLQRTGVDPALLLITSYSIHYTKLYECLSRR